MVNHNGKSGSHRIAINAVSRPIPTEGKTSLWEKHSNAMLGVKNVKKIRDGILIQVKIPYEVINKIDQMAKAGGVTRTDAIRKILGNGTAFMIADSVAPKTKTKTKTKVKVYDPSTDGWPLIGNYAGRESEYDRDCKAYGKFYEQLKGG